MRIRYIVAYDISNPRRLQKVHRKMQDFGEPLQYSVFLCDFSPAEKVLLIENLLPLINQREDQVLIFDLGSSAGRGQNVIESLGRGFDQKHTERLAIIVRIKKARERELNAFNSGIRSRGITLMLECIYKKLCKYKMKIQQLFDNLSQTRRKTISFKLFTTNAISTFEKTWLH